MSGETPSSGEGQQSGGVTELPILNGETGEEVGRTIIPPGKSGGVEVTRDPNETEEGYQATLAAARQVAGGGLPAPGPVIEHQPLSSAKQTWWKGLWKGLLGWLPGMKK